MKSLPAGLILDMLDSTTFLTLGDDKVVALYSNDEYEPNEIYYLTPRGSNVWSMPWGTLSDWYNGIIARDWNGNISVRLYSLYDHADYDDCEWDYGHEEYYLDRYQDYKY